MPKLFAVGDIHGRADLLAPLLNTLNPQPKDTLIFLGDFIDRGSDSRQVIELIRQYQAKCHVVVLMGNHEQMMLDSYDDAGQLKFWLQHGGAETLKSFGVTPDWHGLFQIPRDDYDWLQQTQPYYETENFIFTHATPQPTHPMTQQSEISLRWRLLTADFSKHISGKTVVCGHTEQRDGKIFQGDGIICIDTYAYGGQCLTALELHSMTAWQVGQDLSVQTVQL